MPQHVVGELNRQPLDDRLLAPKTGGIEMFQFAHQHGHGPPIRDDVVHDDQQRMVVLRVADKMCAQQRCAVEPHRLRDEFLQVFAQPVFPRRGFSLLALVVQSVHPDGDRHGGADARERLPLVVLDKARSQAFVPIDHRLQRGLQGLDVQPPAKAQRMRDVVRLARSLQTVEEPQALLRAGQGQTRRPSARHHGMARA
ncbi:hypothetical protein Y694_04706 [Methylibium sp. T29-B]|nr:hypothetical protein Y694_04706 [Methylibium sp. T29-B]